MLKLDEDGTVLPESMSPDERHLLNLIRQKIPSAYVESEDGRQYYWVYNDGCYLCASPTARIIARERGMRCCVGGPCNEPAAGSTVFEALTRAYAGLS